MLKTTHDSFPLGEEAPAAAMLRRIAVECSQFITLQQGDCAGLKPDELRVLSDTDLSTVRDEILQRFEAAQTDTDPSATRSNDKFVGNLAAVVGAIVNRDWRQGHAKALKLLDILDSVAKDPADSLPKVHSLVWRGYLNEVMAQELGASAISALSASRPHFEAALLLADSLVQGGQLSCSSTVLLAPLVNIARIRRTLAAFAFKDSDGDAVSDHDEAQAVSCARMKIILTANAGSISPSLCNGLYELGRYAERLNNEDEARDHYVSAIEMAQRLEAKRLEAHCRHRLAGLVSDAEAVVHLRKAFSIYQAMPLSIDETTQVMEECFGAMTRQELFMKRIVAHKREQLRKTRAELTDDLDAT